MRTKHLLKQIKQSRIIIVIFFWIKMIISIIFLFRIVFFFFSLFVFVLCQSQSASEKKKKKDVIGNEPPTVTVPKTRAADKMMHESLRSKSGRFTGRKQVRRRAFRAVRPALKINTSVRRWTKCIVCWRFISCSDGDPVVPLAGWRLKSVIVSKVMSLKYINMQRWPDTEDKEHSLQLAHETLPGPLSFVCV